MDPDAWHRERVSLQSKVDKLRAEYERLNKKSGMKIDADLAWKRWCWARQALKDHMAKK